MTMFVIVLVGVLVMVVMIVVAMAFMFAMVMLFERRAIAKPKQAQPRRIHHLYRDGPFPKVFDSRLQPGRKFMANPEDHIRVGDRLRLRRFHRIAVRGCAGPDDQRRRPYALHHRACDGMNRRDVGDDLRRRDGGGGGDKGRGERKTDGGHGGIPVCVVAERTCRML